MPRLVTTGIRPYERESAVAGFSAHQIEILRCEYCRSRTRKNLIALLRSDVADPRVLALIEKLETCDARRKRRCGLICCPSCGRQRQKFQARKDNKNIWARMGVIGDAQTLSYVTMRIEALDLAMPRVREATKKFKRWFDRFWRSKLKDCAFLGYFEIGLHGHLHIHALIFHPTRGRAELKEVLREAFQHRNAPHFSDWHQGRPLDSSVRRVLRYMVKPHAKILSGAAASSLPRSIAYQLGLCLVAREELGATNQQGARFKINMKRTRRFWKYGALFDPRHQHVLVFPDMDGADRYGWWGILQHGAPGYTVEHEAPNPAPDGPMIGRILIYVDTWGANFSFGSPFLANPRPRPDAGF